MGERTCSVDGCEERVHSRGWCNRHHARWLRHGDPLWTPAPHKQGCVIDGCERPHAARGWCKYHWEKWYKHGDPLYVWTPRKRYCSVDGCGLPRYGPGPGRMGKPGEKAGLCSLHWQRWKKHGDPLYVWTPPPRCAFEGCANVARRQGWCGAHFARWQRWGDPAGKRALNGSWSIDSYGYMRRYVNGVLVIEHRWMMEQMLGRSLMKDEQVHHLNGVRDDNRPENLELWSTSQPAGQRIEDKVEWAKEILARYGMEFIQPRLWDV